MPTMVSFQKNIKKYQRVLGYIIFIIIVLITHLKMCPRVPLNYFCAFSECVSDVASTNARKAFIEVQLVVNVEGVLRPQR
jgi:hypothetical protein